MNTLTEEQVESYERGVVEIEKKIAGAKRPWIVEAHKHTKATMEGILASHRPRRESVSVGDDVEESREGYEGFMDRQRENA